MRAVESPLVVELPAAFGEHPSPGATAELLIRAET